MGRIGEEHQLIVELCVEFTLPHPAVVLLKAKNIPLPRTWLSRNGQRHKQHDNQWMFFILDFTTCTLCQDSGMYTSMFFSVPRFDNVGLLLWFPKVTSPRDHVSFHSMS